MATVLSISTGASSIAQGVTTNFPWGHTSGANPSTTEADAQHTIQYGGTYHNLWVKISANTLSVGSNTIRLRIDGVNGNSLVTIGASSGESTFEDTSNTDVIASGKKLNYQIITSAGTGTITPRSVACLFDCTTNTTITIMGGRVGGGRALSVDSTQTLFELGAGLNTNSTEKVRQIKAKGSATLANLSVRVTANTRGSNTPARSRIGGANGNQLVTILIATNNAELQDTSNTDAIVNTNLYCYDITTGGSGGSVTVAFQAMDLTTSTNNYQFAGTPIQSRAANLVANNSLSGSGDGTNPVETFFDVKSGQAMTLSFLGMYINANTLTATSTVFLRKNSANGNQNLSIPSTTNDALVEDTSNTDTTVVADLLHYQLTTGATGTSISWTTIAMWVALSSGGTPTFTAVSDKNLLLIGAGT